MVVPAGIYLLLNAGSDSAGGWGIPVATDIAFALGVLTLAASRAPVSLRSFLLTLAIVDDIGAILLIAIFYSGGLAAGWLAVAVVIIASVVLVRLLGVTSMVPYVLLGWRSGSRSTSRVLAPRWPGLPSDFWHRPSHWVDRQRL